MNSSGFVFGVDPGILTGISKHCEIGHVLLTFSTFLLMISSTYLMGTFLNIFCD